MPSTHHHTHVDLQLGQSRLLIFQLNIPSNLAFTRLTTYDGVYLHLAHSAEPYFCVGEAEASCFEYPDRECCIGDVKAPRRFQLSHLSRYRVCGQ